MEIGTIFGMFIGLPVLALAPSAIFALIYVRCRRRIVLLAALAWLAYYLYEQAMKLRILCSGDCNIRIDLLLLYPLLALLSALAVLAYFRSKASNGEHS